MPHTAYQVVYIMLSAGGSLSYYSTSSHAWPKGAVGFNYVVACPFSTAHSYQLRMTETGEYPGVAVYIYWTMAVVDNSTHKTTKITDNVRDADFYLGKPPRTAAASLGRRQNSVPSGNTSDSGIDKHAYQFPGFRGSSCAQEGKQARTGTVTAFCCCTRAGGTKLASRDFPEGCRASTGGHARRRM